METLGQNVASKVFVAHGRIHETRGAIQNAGQAKGARGAALLVLIGLGHLVIAIVLWRFRLHLRAAIRFLDFRDERLARDRGEGERTAEEQAEQDLENPSHRPALYHAP